MRAAYLFRLAAVVGCGAAIVGRAQSQPFATAGALGVPGATEVGVVFNQPVSRASLNSLDNFSVSAGEIQALRYVELNGAVVLRVTGLQPNAVYSLSLTNLQSPEGTAYPGTTVTFTNGPMSWVAVGGRELGFGTEAVAVGGDGFDLISGGVQMREDYDEATFAYEQVTGDFDRRVRVAFQEPSSEEARAGLMVREALDAGRARPVSIEDSFARYLQVHVTPKRTAYGDAARDQYQVIARFYPGGVGSPTFEETLLLETASPADTNAWLRLRRRGQTFTAFRGTNGTNWTQLGSFTFPTVQGLAPFANTAFVGPSYSPETGAIPLSTGARRAFLASFREYGLASGDEPTEPPTLRIVRVGNEVEITWSGGGVLQASTTLQPNSWTDLPGAGSPYRTPVNAQQRRFFRVRL